jgi:TolB-like protein/Tfp pilus assembly protein PilF
VSLKSVFAELQRRHVLRVVGAYAVAAWVLVEVYTTVQPILLEQHEWTSRFVVILALLGFPVVFALAWIFDITPDGVRRTMPLAAPPAQSPQQAAAGSVGRGVGFAARQRTLSARATGFFGLGILVALVVVAAYAGYHHDARGVNAAETAPIESIAVLPFLDMSPGQDQEYFSDGVTEELLNRLARVPDLRVAARTSSFVFKGSSQDVREIGRRLGVQSVLEGSVRREGDRLRVSTKLIDVTTGYQLWSDSFDGEATSVFDLQDDIANAVVDALRQRFAAAPEAGRRGTSNVRAYELYLLGLKRWNGRNDRDLRQALVHFREAIEEDPRFALAYAGLAQTYAVLPAHGPYPVDSAAILGSAAAAQALAYDASMADAYAAMGQIVQNFEWDLSSAEGYYRRALRYEPGNATTHQWYAETLMLLGRYDEAEIHVERVLASDPLAPGALFVDAFLKLVRGRSDDALATWRDIVRLHPDFASGVAQHAFAAIAAARPDEAARSVERLGSFTPQHAPVYASLAAALREDAEGAARRPARDATRSALRRADAFAPSERAAWYMALGEADAALAALEQGFAQQTDANLLYLLVHPLMAPVRERAEFRQMVTQLGLVAEG